MRLAIDRSGWLPAAATILVFALTGPAGATFVQRPTTLPGLKNSAVAWGDYDRDGDLDLALAGVLTGGAPWITAVYRNDGGDPPVFVDIGAGLPVSALGDIAWGDFDNDGDLDLLLTGLALLPGNKTTKVFRNTGSSPPFVEVPSDLTGFGYSEADWGDYDNDGDLDIAVYGSVGYGWNNDTPAGAVYVNNGDTTPAFSDAGANLLGAMDGSVHWVDYDRDGDLDLTATGLNQQVYPYTHFLSYRNSGTSSPVLQLALFGVGMTRGSVDWADCNGDGRLDLLQAGYTGSGPATLAFASSGDFAQPHSVQNPWFSWLAGLPGIFLGTAGWGDFDNDGLSDIVAVGLTDASASTATIYRNSGGSYPSFSDLGAGLIGQGIGASCWGDYDADGDLDLLITGRTGSVDGATTLYRNDAAVVNRNPEPPTGLASQALASLRAQLQWPPGTDSETPSASLTYNVRIGSLPGADDICSPMSLQSGHRLLPAAGNAATTLERVVQFPHPGRYYWSVQSVDAGFAGSAFAPEQFVDVGTATDVPLQVGTQGSALDLRVRHSGASGRWVEFGIPEGGRTTLDVYAVNGRRIGRLIERDLAAGTYMQAWDTSRLAHGVYLLRLSAPAGQVTRRAVLR